MTKKLESMHKYDLVPLQPAGPRDLAVPAEDSVTNKWTRTESPDGTVKITESEKRARKYR
jgi:hypothetical protein